MFWTKINLHPTNLSKYFKEKAEMGTDPVGTRDDTVFTHPDVKND